jgi:Ni,Fe-hydrogenase I cytochrome b subunit
VERFTRAERAFHGATALAVFILMGTGWFIWRKQDDWEILGVNVLSQGHVWLGGVLLVIAAVAFLLLGRRRRVAFAERRFKPGQRAALRVITVVLGYMVASGVLLYLREFVEMSKATRALIRQAHLLGGWVVVAFLAAHLAMVLLVPKNRGLIAGILTGRVKRNVARRATPGWLPDGS